MNKESCPYCGEMTEMKLEKGVWVSGSCEHCKKDLAAVAAAVPEFVEEKPDLKAKAEDLP